MNDEATLGFYDREAATYADWTSPAKPNRWLEAFLAKFDAPARLLDYGCGGGWGAKRMLDAGHEVEAFDGSPGLAAEAAKRTGLPVKAMVFDGFDATDRYDGVWCSFCLLHVPCADMPGNLARIHRALRPSGRLYLGLKAGKTGEARDSLGRLYSYFEPLEMFGLLEAAGFARPEMTLRPEEGYDGAPVTGMHIYARRSDG